MGFMSVGVQEAIDDSPQGTDWVDRHVNMMLKRIGGDGAIKLSVWHTN